MEDNGAKMDDVAFAAADAVAGWMGVDDLRGSPCCALYLS
jgi:hypothetical protein